MYHVIIGLWILWSIYAIWRMGSLRHDLEKIEEDMRLEQRGKTRRINHIANLEAENAKHKTELESLRKHDLLRKMCRNHGLKIHSCGDSGPAS